MLLKDLLTSLNKNLKSEFEPLIVLNSDSLEVKYFSNFSTIEEAYEHINSAFSASGYNIEDFIYPQVEYKQKEYVMTDYDIDLKNLSFFIINFKLLDLEDDLSSEFDFLEEVEDLEDTDENSLNEMVARFLTLTASEDSTVLYTIEEIKKLEFNEYGQVIKEQNAPISTESLKNVSVDVLNNFFKKQKWKNSDKDDHLIYYPWDLEHIFYYSSDTEGYKLTISAYDTKTKTNRTLTQNDYKDLNILTYKSFDNSKDKIFYIDKIVGIRHSKDKNSEKKADLTKIILNSLNITDESNKKLLKNNKVNYENFSKIILKIDNDVKEGKYQDFSIDFKMIQDDELIELDNRSKNNLIQQIRESNTEYEFFKNIEF